jgi:hypothetical protein
MVQVIGQLYYKGTPKLNSFWEIKIKALLRHNGPLSEKIRLLMKQSWFLVDIGLLVYTCRTYWRNRA